MLVDHLRQLRSHTRGGRSNQSDRPPTYEEVVKPSTSTETSEESEEPPSYLEATTITNSTQEPENEEEDVTESTTVVTVEVNRPGSSSSC